MCQFAAINNEKSAESSEAVHMPDWLAKCEQQEITRAISMKKTLRKICIFSNSAIL